MTLVLHILIAIVPVVLMAKLIIAIDDKMIEANEERKRALYKRAPYLKPTESDE